MIRAAWHGSTSSQPDRQLLYILLQREGAGLWSLDRLHQRAHATRGKQCESVRALRDTAHGLAGDSGAAASEAERERTKGNRGRRGAGAAIP